MINNKKGQDPVMAIVAALVGLALISVLIPIISNSFNSITCKNERNTIDSLNSQLTICQNQNTGLTGQLQDQEYLENQLSECVNQFEEKSSKLNGCLNYHETFPLFWTFNIYLTEGWIFILNLYLIITIPLLTIKIIFQSKKD